MLKLLEAFFNYKSDDQLKEYVIYDAIDNDIRLADELELAYVKGWITYFENEDRFENLGEL